MPASCKVSTANIAIIGAGWAGLAAAVRAVEAGCQVTVLEASRSLGGRARGVEVSLPDGKLAQLDNGQHVLLGAYTETLALMAQVGVDAAASFMRLPVKLSLLQTQRWSWLDYVSLVRCILGWSLQGFQCKEAVTVLALCKSASSRVMADVFEPLCLSALNTAPIEASGRVFLRVLKDAFASRKSAEMLIPQVDLSTLFPNQAALWLQERGAVVRLGERVTSLVFIQNQWRVNGEVFDQVVVAAPPWEAARLLRDIAPDWAGLVDALEYRAIATVYALATAEFDLASPIQALPSDAMNPAQFVFKRREAKGLLAFVVSDSTLERDELQRLVLAQGESALGVALQLVTTIMEKRATFACIAGLKKPAKLALAGLSVVGDYLDEAYPATIEAAVRSAG